MICFAPLAFNLSVQCTNLSLVVGCHHTQYTKVDFVQLNFLFEKVVFPWSSGWVGLWTTQPPNPNRNRTPPPTKNLSNAAQPPECNRLKTTKNQRDPNCLMVTVRGWFVASIDRSRLVGSRDRISARPPWVGSQLGVGGQGRKHWTCLGVGGWV